MIGALILGVLVPMLLAGAFLLGRHLPRRQGGAARLSPVTRQHIDLFQGGQLNEAVVEAAKSQFRDLLERGEVATVEASMRPGTNYVFQVRALAEIGTEQAGRILERQLQRRLSDDQLEQSWYWIDLASSLRSINRQESLPILLRCADNAQDNPLGHFFAAETVCFLGFAGYLHHLDNPLGRSALRLLHSVLEGLRFGLPPQVVTEGRLGEVLENLWDNRPDRVEPLLVRIALETRRLLRRSGHAEKLLSEEKNEHEAFGWQMSRLAAIEPMLIEYLESAGPELVARLDSARADERVGIFQALIDLRTEAGPELLKLLEDPAFAPAELGIELLGWSKDARVGPWLRQFLADKVPMIKRAQKRRQSKASKKPAIDAPYRAILRALRGHAAPETEGILMLAARDFDPTYRASALASFGWWEPMRRSEVLATLEDGRRDPNADVRQAARAALARLGERHALQWFRQSLVSEQAESVHDAMQLVANEGLYLLWPDLDRLADSENPDLSAHAREALERLCEEMDRG